MDGLELYGSEYLHIRFQSALLERVKKLEAKAQALAASGLPCKEFTEKHALLVGRFMLGVQNVLALTSLEKNDYVPWTSRLSNQDFAKLIWEFYKSPTELEKIQILAQTLEGWNPEAPTFSPGALRSLTTLAGFLDSAEWGVLCWRTLACMGFESMTELKLKRLPMSLHAVQSEFEALNAHDVVLALARMRLLICHALPGAAQVAAALFCTSLDLWPADADFELSHTSKTLELSPGEPRTATV